ncbi:unnamed protein product [Blumeria hordei]|uniref:Dynamin-type G domain-containing protein n=1 Tax=Blumeria hordei TaxID=2867405 RepID=A0A383UQ25_BLUHO|nr:unnamed protein product [Blumeria hordei]
MPGEFRNAKGKDIDREEFAAHSSNHHYMTVGNGVNSECAAQLRSLMDNNPVENINTTNENPPRLDQALNNSVISPRYAGILEPHSNDRRTQASAIQQLWYNQHRVTLARSINRVIETLQTLQEMNSKWPATYPSAQRAEAVQLQKNYPSPGSIYAYDTGFPRPNVIKRAQTSFEDQRTTEAESSSVADKKAITEPRLITPQIAQEFSILKLDLKLGSLHQTELVHSLEKGSIASLLDGKISSSIKHLHALRERIDDTSSKVLVTGDLNAGKSTFCNALLRRKILPEDQQPCTSIFCEVLDAKENSGVEEVHAVHKNVIYNRHDERSYDVFKLSDLERLVVSNDLYTQCKVYVKDIRTIDESLLNNGIVDISIIDAPGLNMDTTKTTAVFARQEEIDVVVFVVSAANHFTITAQEFIWAAAAEKAYIFIVVNGYDNIRDKERCQKMILKQIAGLSPRTFKENVELVHFVSSNAVPTISMPPNMYPGDSKNLPSENNGDDSDFDDQSSSQTGKGKEKEKVRDFENLEQSLRRFVLEKRARSKLAPAKTYLLNVLGDVHTLASVNLEVAQSELDRVIHELDQIEPLLERSKKAKAEVSDDIDRTIDETCREIYDHTKHTLSETLSQTANSDLGISYPGLWASFQYADDLKEAMLSQISVSLTSCEEHARRQTVQGVYSIKQLGLLHLGDEYSDLNFRSDVMFRRKRDLIAKQIEIETEIWDFFDWNSIMHQQEKMASTGLAITVVTAASGKLFGGWSWVDGTLATMKAIGLDNIRRLIIPGALFSVIAATYYTLSLVPKSLPRRLSAKLSTQLQSMDFVHTNSDRISSSVRKVLRFPADNLRVGLQRSVEQLGIKQAETKKIKGESEVARKYFSNLVNETRAIQSTVEAVDLEGVTPGVVGGYSSLS